MSTILSRFLLCAALGMIFVGSARAQATKAVEALMETKAGRVFFEELGISRSRSPDDILGDLQKLPPADESVVMRALSDFGKSMSVTTEFDTPEERVEKKRHNDQIAEGWYRRQLWLAHDPNRYAAAVAKAVAEAADRSHVAEWSGISRADTSSTKVATASNVAIGGEPVLRIDLKQFDGCRNSPAAKFTRFGSDDVQLSTAVIYGRRNAILAFMKRGYVRLNKCALPLMLLNQFLDTLPTETSKGKDVGLDSQEIRLDTSPEEFVRLAVTISSVPSIKPPNSAPPPPTLLGRTSASDTSFRAESQHDQCHWDEYCLTADRHAKLSVKCGDFAVEVSAEGAKVGVGKGPAEISFSVRFDRALSGQR